jgi:hypothetical protein
VKAQCEKCKEIVPLSFTVAAVGIDVTCGACGADYHVAASKPLETPVPRPAGDMVCPKCGEAQPPATACRRCGLIQDRWRGPESAADGTELDLASAREAAALWDACLVRWEDPATHDAFLAHCEAAGTFAFAAARYRGAQQTRGDGDPVTTARLKQVRNMAELALVRPTPRPKQEVETPSLYKNAVILLTLGLTLLAGGFVYLLITRG